VKKQQKNDRNFSFHLVKQTNHFKINIKLLLEDNYALYFLQYRKTIEKDREFQRTMKE